VCNSHPSGLKLSAKNKKIIKTKSSIILFKKAELKIYPIYQKRDYWDKHFNAFIDIKDKNLRKISLSDYVKQELNLKNFKINENSLKNSKFRNLVFKNRGNIFQSTKEITLDGKKISLNNPDTVVEYKSGEYAFNGRRLSPLSKSINSVGFDGCYQEDFSLLLCDFWDDMNFNNSQNEGGVSFPSGKKPELLLARVLSMFTKKGDLVLDYHLGSGTTCAVAHKMGRQYIGIEQMDYIEDIAVKRMQKVIGATVKKDGELLESLDFASCPKILISSFFPSPVCPASENGNIVDAVTPFLTSDKKRLILGDAVPFFPNQTLLSFRASLKLS
jgi:adenine-specific DNA-methyltransferase